jgi:hypothetical protein
MLAESKAQWMVASQYGGWHFWTEVAGFGLSHPLVWLEKCLWCGATAQCIFEQLEDGWLC